MHTPESHDYKLLSNNSRKRDATILLDYAKNVGLLSSESNHNISDFKFDKFDDGYEGLSYLLLANKLVSKEIELALVTDHNSIKGFPKIVEAMKILKKFKLKTFKKYPEIVLGIEVSCSDKNHVVGIFDHIKTTNRLQLWIDEYIMSPKDGTYLTSIDVLNKIKDLGGIGYIAHINSSDIFAKRYLSQTYKEKLFNSSSLNLLGLSDLNKKNIISEKLRQVTKREFDFILDEDSHTLQQLGEKHFWIKAQKLGFQAIKNAIKDFSVSLSFEEHRRPEKYIKGIYIENKGFLGGKKKGAPLLLTFSEAMNSFIGGRGTGKSSVLNTLDFLLSQSTESRSIVNNICMQGTACILYSYKNIDYYIIFNGADNKGNDSEFISEYYNTVPNALYAVPIFEKKQARNIMIRKRLNMYQFENGKAKLIDTNRQVLNDIYSHVFSVNDLVITASGENINDFIVELMRENEIVSKKIRIHKTSSDIDFIKRMSKKTSGLLLNRKNEVLLVINKFNSIQNDKLRIVYSQKEMDEIVFPWKEMFNITHYNGTEFFKKYNIVKIQLHSYLIELSKIVNPLRLIILFNDKKYKEIQNKVSIIDFLDRGKNQRKINLEIKNIDVSNFELLMDEIRKTILNSLNMASVYIKEYFHNVDNYNLEFNIDNKEMSSNPTILFKKVSTLSMGQKVVAMLSFILAYNDFSEDYLPLIIDQPEDNLDNQYIYKNLVQDLRNSKSKRQIIVATHNSTIVTNTGSEQVIVMESDGDSGWIEQTGYPTEKTITKHIINKLEGGNKAFTQKVFLYDEVINQK